MPEITPELQAEIDKLGDYALNASAMTDAELEEETTEVERQLSKRLDESTTILGVGATAERLLLDMLASSPTDGAYSKWAERADRPADVVTGLAKHYVLSRLKAARAAAAQGGDTSGINLDSSHYDDGHALGWTKKPPGTTPAETPSGVPLDSSHYDDGHAFGWPHKDASPPATSAPTAATGSSIGKIPGAEPKPIEHQQMPEQPSTTSSSTPSFGVYGPLAKKERSERVDYGPDPTAVPDDGITPSEHYDPTQQPSHANVPPSPSERSQLTPPFVEPYVSDTAEYQALKTGAAAAPEVGSVPPPSVLYNPDPTAVIPIEHQEMTPSETPSGVNLDSTHYDDGHALSWTTHESDMPVATPEATPFVEKPPPIPESDLPAFTPLVEGPAVPIPPDHGQWIDGLGALASPPAESTKKPMPPPEKPTSSLPVPLIGAGAVLVLVAAAVGFAFANSSKNVSSPQESSTAAAPANAVTPANCDPAPDLSLALTGAANVKATKGCLPLRFKPGAATSPSTPYCRLQGIPNPPGTVAGVLSVAIAFVAEGQRYEVQMDYVADQRVAPNNGKLPATLTVGDGQGRIGLFTWDATKTPSPANTTSWNAQSGVFSFAADGASGTIDADFASNAGQTIHLGGGFSVAGGCPKTG